MSKYLSVSNDAPVYFRWDVSLRLHSYYYYIVKNKIFIHPSMSD